MLQGFSAACVFLLLLFFMGSDSADYLGILMDFLIGFLGACVILAGVGGLFVLTVDY